MTSLRDALAETLLLAADEAAEMTDQAPRPGTSKTWQLTADFAGLPQVTDLVTTSGEVAHAVCSRIRWQAPMLDYRAGHQSYTDVLLPLSSDFLVRSFTSRGGETKAARYWQPMKTDVAFQAVYGYRVTASGIAPLSRAEKEKDDFSDFDGWFGTLASMLGNGTRSRATRTVFTGSPRFLVVVSLVCCQEALCDPFGAVNAARIFPLTMLKANRFVEGISRLRFAIEVERPSGPRPYFFADRNNLPFPPPLPGTATWEDMFDYYLLQPGTGEYVVVDPERSAERINKDTRYTIAFTGGDSLIVEPARLPTTVRKVARQGAFDNMHISPPMSFQGRTVFMAPICQHDCLHTHFRWGETVRGLQKGDFGSDYLFKNEGWFKGWSEEFVPNSIWGAPLVPPDQKITVKTTASGFQYKAETGGEPSKRPHEWQIAFHHGSYYALSLNPGMTFFAVGARNPGAEDYYYLRYEKSTDAEWIAGPPVPGASGRVYQDSAKLAQLLAPL